MFLAFSPFRFRWLLEASRWPQDGPREPQKRPERAPRRPQTALPGSLGGASWGRLGASWRTHGEPLCSLLRSLGRIFGASFSHYPVFASDMLRIFFEALRLPKDSQREPQEWAPLGPISRNSSAAKGTGDAGVSRNAPLGGGGRAQFRETPPRPRNWRSKCFSKCPAGGTGGNRNFEEQPR